MLTRGKVMSGAPICKGVTKLPKAPKASGTMARNTMIVPCMAPKELYKSGDMTPIDAVLVFADRFRAVDPLQQLADEGNRLPRMPDLPAHQQHQAEAKKHEQQRGNAVLQADDLVVGGKNVFPPKPQFVMLMADVGVVRMC